MNLKNFSISAGHLRIFPYLWIVFKVRVRYPQIIREVSPASFYPDFLEAKASSSDGSVHKSTAPKYGMWWFSDWSIWGEGQPLDQRQGNHGGFIGGNDYSLILSNRGSPCCYRSPGVFPRTRIRNTRVKALMIHIPHNCTPTPLKSQPVIPTPLLSGCKILGPRPFFAPTARVRYSTRYTTWDHNYEMLNWNYHPVHDDNH